MYSSWCRVGINSAFIVCVSFFFWMYVEFIFALYGKFFEFGLFENFLGVFWKVDFWSFI